MKAIGWEPAALDELDAALALSRDPVAFRAAVDAALDDIAAGRVTHAREPRTAARRCILTTPPYSIVYIETDNEVRVYAFPHHRRRTNYWKNRLPKP